MSKTDLKGHLDWLTSLSAAQGGIERSGVLSGANQAQRSRRQRNQRVLIGSKSFSVRGGTSIDQRAILDATEHGVNLALDRVLK